MLEPKVPALGACVGFVLSFLVGLVSQATFSSIFFRAIIMAILFGAITFAARIVINRFLPELLDGTASDTPSVDNSGKMVDITIGENHGDGFPFDDSGKTDMNSMIPDFLEPEMHETESSADVGESVAANIQRTASASAGQPAPITNGSVQPAEDKAFSGGLDVLPDLQDFTPQKKAETGEESDPFQVESGIGSKDSVFVTPDSGTMSAETATMAKAIRTILSRDVPQ
jgi:hypothetical protein